MAESVREAVLIASVLATGLFAGLFYAFSVAVMPGLARGGDRTFVEAMQRINNAILNPWFAVVFAGTPPVLLAAAVLHAPAGQWGPLVWLVAALVLVLLVIGVTMSVNVPLNNALDDAGPQGSEARATRVRRGFERRWVRWNTLRTALSALALACVALALVS